MGSAVEGWDRWVWPPKKPFLCSCKGSVRTEQTCQVKKQLSAWCASAKASGIKDRIWICNQKEQTPAPNTLIACFSIKALKVRDEVLLALITPNEVFQKASLLVGLMYLEALKKLLYGKTWFEKDSHFWFKIFCLGQELSLQGLCFLLRKKCCLLNIHVVCRLSRKKNLLCH